MAMSVHPNKTKLKHFMEGKLRDDEQATVRAHVDRCEFCREFCEDYKSLVESLDWAWSVDVPEAARDLADRLQWTSGISNVIDLKPFVEPHTDVRSAIEPVGELALAADGSGKAETNVPRCLATYYSENPDIVLHVMSYPKQEGKYVQITSDDPSLSSNVILQLPDLDREFLTDQDGRAILEEGLIQDYTGLKWRVKLPDAEFELSHLIYDPDETKYSSETTLETEKRDKIHIKFEGKAEGKLIVIEVIQLEGKSEFGSVKVVVSQGGSSHAQQTDAGRPVSFEITKANVPISIRLFR